MAIPSRKKDRVEIVDPNDLKLTAIEASSVAAIAQLWPGGMGEVLVRCESKKRGFTTDPNFHVFKKDYQPPENALLCPVMEVKRLRAWPNLYHLHLSAWRSLRDAYAVVLEVDLPTARALYNEHLKSNPLLMAEIFTRYSDM
jgi:hypothetical protein